MPIAVTTTSAPPTADLYLSALPSGTTKVWVWRMWEDRESRVRGDDTSVIIGTETRMVDYDLPVGRPVQYRAQCFATDGSELASVAASSAVTVSLANPQTAWLSDPIAPALARLVAIEGSSDRTRTYASDTTYAQVIGSQDPVAISGIRSSAGEWSFTFIAFNDEESEALETLFGGGGTLLIRANAATVRHRTGLIYLSSPAVRETPRHDVIYPWSARTDWEVSGQQVRPPSVSVVAPLREYEDVATESANYQGVLDSYTDYLALLRG